MAKSKSKTEAPEGMLSELDKIHKFFKDRGIDATASDILNVYRFQSAKGVNDAHSSLNDHLDAALKMALSRAETVGEVLGTVSKMAGSLNALIKNAQKKDKT